MQHADVLNISCAASDESSDYAYKSDEDSDLRYGMATDMEL
jgi:hypothetical protein